MFMALSFGKRTPLAFGAFDAVWSAAGNGRGVACNSGASDA
jgi:hypothetical protein